MIGEILERFRTREKVEVESYESSAEVFRQNREEKLKELEQKTEKFQKKSKKVIKELENNLEELEGFEDSKKRDVIDDVVSNIVEDRKKLVKDFSPKEEPEKLRSELEKFLEDFRSMSRKEAAVMEEAYLQERFSEQLGKIESLVDELENFLNSEYTTWERLETLEEDVEKIGELEEELENLEKELENINTGELKEKLDEKEQELQELKQSDLYTEYRKIRDEIEEKRSQNQESEEEIGKAMRKMERGLKKLLYEGEVGKISREGSEILREIRDHEKEELLERDPEKVAEAAEATASSTDKDFLKESTREKLLEGARKLEKLPEILEEIQRRENRIEELEKEAETHKAIEKKERIEEERKEARQKLSETGKREEKVREQKREKESQLENLKQEVLEIMESEFGGVTLENK